MRTIPRHLQFSVGDDKEAEKHGGHDGVLPKYPEIKQRE